MKKVGIVALSNGQTEEDCALIAELETFLEECGIESVESPYLRMREGLISAASPQKRAEAVNELYQNPTIDAIFDVSGGDMANEVLPFLDYESIKKSRAVFYGYSDLTTVINAIYAKTKKASVLLQLKQTVKEESGIQKKRVKAFLTHPSVPLQADLFQANWRVLQGEEDLEKLLQYPILGGNIRCFLKLAGTEYLPDIRGKLLFLEALSGGVPQISTYFAQLSQLGILTAARGILLGSFTQLEQEGSMETAADILKEYLPKDSFVAKTEEIGHARTSKAMIIGNEERR